jgi:hypothetical protein
MDLSVTAYAVYEPAPKGRFFLMPDMFFDCVLFRSGFCCLVVWVIVGVKLKHGREEKNEFLPDSGERIRWARFWFLVWLV